MARLLHGPGHFRRCLFFMGGTASVPSDDGAPISTPPHGADGADALQGIGQQWPWVRGNDDRRRPGGLAVPRSRGTPTSRPFHGADGGTPSRASAHNGPGFVATMIEGGLEGCVPRSRGAPISRPFHAADGGTPSRASAHNGHGFVATMIEGGLEGFAVPRSRGAPISRPFHGANGADALQGIGPQWPFLKRIAYLNCGPNSGLVLNFVPQPRRAVVDMARVT